jgi:hypothetical protein
VFAVEPSRFVSAIAQPAAPTGRDGRGTNTVHVERLAGPPWAHSVNAQRSALKPSRPTNAAPHGGGEPGHDQLTTPTRTGRTRGTRHDRRIRRWAAPPTRPALHRHGACPAITSSFLMRSAIQPTPGGSRPVPCRRRAAVHQRRHSAPRRSRRFLAVRRELRRTSRGSGTCTGGHRAAPRGGTVHDQHHVHRPRRAWRRQPRRASMSRATTLRHHLTRQLPAFGGTGNRPQRADTLPTRNLSPTGTTPILHPARALTRAASRRRSMPSQTEASSGSSPRPTTTPPR